MSAPRFRVFLSSTSIDLTEHRDAVRQAIEELEQSIERMEVFVASHRSPFDECMRRVDDCDALVVLVAHRYGWIPSTDEGGDGERSITWHEVERARENGKPVFAFLVDESAPWTGPREQDRLTTADPSEFVAIGEAVKKLREFKAFLSTKLVHAKFSTPESAGARIATSLARWLLENLPSRSGTDTSAHSTRPDDLFERDVADYLRALEQQHDSIQLAGFETKVRVPIRLEEMFVPLDVAVDEREFGRMHAGDALQADEELGPARKIPLTEGFRRAEASGGRRGLVVLGDPGSGKTTHLRRLLLWVVREGTQALGLPADTIPVFLPLRDLRSLDAGLPELLQAQLDGNPHLRTDEGFSARLLARGRLLFLLDGLDEIPSLGDRQRVVAWIEEAIVAHADSRFVVTSRYAGYRPLRQQFSSRFLELHLRFLTTEQATDFVHNWFRIVETTFAADRRLAEAKAAEAADELLATLSSGDFRSARVFELTRNPLLLTAICLVARDRGHLPRRRADLFDECVNVLLERWRDAKKLGVSLDARSARLVLQPVAYWLHEREGRTRATAAELAPVIEPVLARIGGGGLTAQRFLDTIRDESGLLTGWSDDSYGFLHLGFQEYLAARHIRSRALEDPETRIRELAERFGESWWREVTLLLLSLDEPSYFGRLMTEVVRLPSFREHEALVQACLLDTVEFVPEPFLRLLEEEPGEDEQRWGRQLVAVRALRAQDPALLEPLAERLREHPDPAMSGLFGRELVFTVSEVIAISDTTLPALEPSGLELVLVPEGRFEMGSTKAEQQRWGPEEEWRRRASRESPLHVVGIASFYLATRPVTNEQYARFLAANPGTREPEEWGNSSFNRPEQPVVGVSWHEANAYCRWARVVLPTEAQWEYACRAGSTTSFWSGDEEEDLDRVGWYSGNSLGRLHAVAEKTANPFGLYDMHGNVWEWCLDQYGPYDLPVRTGTGERIVAHGQRGIVRGGGFNYDGRYARSASRSLVSPSSRWPVLGFRPAKALD